jgi:hypothetical protein
MRNNVQKSFYSHEGSIMTPPTSVQERQVDFIKYVSADFSLCENTWIFLTYLGAISGYYKINSVCSTYTFLLIGTN